MSSEADAAIMQEFGRLVSAENDAATSYISSCVWIAGVSTQVAQSLIQDSLATFSDTDYNRIMSDYKVYFLLA